MLHDLGLPNARYTSHTHEDGEVSAIVTYYGPSEIPGKLLQQFKIGGAPAADFETAEDSAARESIRHTETTEDVEVEDLHYGELKGVMKSYKASSEIDKGKKSNPNSFSISLPTEVIACTAASAFEM
jgi:hypothetical protein